eukprot:2371369-Amphidinium_carterae.1
MAKANQPLASRTRSILNYFFGQLEAEQRRGGSRLTTYVLRCSLTRHTCVYIMSVSKHRLRDFGCLHVRSVDWAWRLAPQT